MAFSKEEIERRINEYESEISNYTEANIADKKKLADLVKEAQGPERSARQFALDLGINVSTLSRIINQKIVNHVDDHLLARIAANAADSSQVSFNDLMNANGKRKDYFNKSIFSGREFELKCCTAITNSLLEKDYVVEQEKNDFISPYDFALKINGEEKWVFDCWFNNNLSKSMIEKKIYRVMMLWFSKDKPSFQKYSIVVNADILFAYIEQILKYFKFPYELSVLLVSNFKVEKEYVIDDLNGNKRKPYF